MAYVGALGAPAHATLESIEGLGGQAVALAADLAVPDEIERLFAETEQRFGGLDLLVNSAATFEQRAFADITVSDWDAVLAVHLKGHYCCSRPFAKYIRENNRTGARIINFSSVSGLYGNFGQANYGAAKAGIADNDWVEAYNTNGALVARAVVSQRMREGTLFMYHAQEKIVNVPGSEVTGQRGGIHNSVTRAVVKPTHMIGGYAQQSYGFNYYGTVGANRDEFVIVRKMENVDWLEGPALEREAAE